MKFLAYFLSLLLLLTPVSYAGEQDVLEVAEEEITFSEHIPSREERLEQMASRGELRVDYFEVSAYTNAPDECGRDYDDPNFGLTSSGKQVAVGMVAAGRAFKIGTRMYIEGIGYVTVEDRGGYITNERLDVYVETKEEAFKIGRKDRKVYIFD